MSLAKRFGLRGDRHQPPSGLGRARSWGVSPLSLLVLAAMAAALLALPTSDATANSGQAPAKPTLKVVVIGDLYSYGFANSPDSVMRLSVPPTLQALNQVQLADTGVQMQVLFIPVWEATWARLYKSSSPKQPPLINAVKDAGLVIAGLGADVPRFAVGLRAAMFGAGAPTRVYNSLMTAFSKGSYQRDETAYLEGIAAREAPGGSVVTLGYPNVQRARLSSGASWWSPLRWSPVSQRQARLTSRLVTALDTGNSQATRLAGAQDQTRHFLFADPSAAAESAAGAAGSASSATEVTLIGNALLPYVNQAVGDELTAMGVKGTANVAPITPASKWELAVQLPTGIREPLPQRGSGPSSRSTAGSSSRQPAATRVAPARQRLSNTQVSPRGNGRRLPVVIRVPVIRAPAAPIPRPIAPQSPPGPIGGGGAGGGRGKSGAGAKQGGGQAGSGSGSQGTGGNTSGSGTTSSGKGTTSSNGGTTSSSGGATSSGMGGSSSGGWSSSGASSSASGGGSSSWGGSSSGGGSSS